jgi:hypothetical protein
MKHASIVRVLFFFRRGDLHMVFVLFLFAIHKVSITKVFKFLGFNFLRFICYQFPCQSNTLVTNYPFFLLYLHIMYKRSNFKYPP